MNKNYHWQTRTSIFTAVVFSLFFTACHFESDKDYKHDEDKAASDSSHSKDHGQDQHEASNPPVDAAKHGDSTHHTAPVTGSDSSIKKDSSKGH